MEAIKAHWITALALLAVGFLIVVGIAVGVGTGESGRDERITYAIVSELAALAILSGLWGLRSNRVRLWVAHTLLVVGVLAFAAAYWWFMFIPLAISLTVLYAGIIRGGLLRELRPV